MAVQASTFHGPGSSSSRDFARVLQARAQFELATREEGHAQSAAFAWLGNWEREVAENQAAARELYNIALDLDHTEPAAGARRIIIH